MKYVYLLTCSWYSTFSTIRPLPKPQQNPVGIDIPFIYFVTNKIKILKYFCLHVKKTISLKAAKHFKNFHGYNQHFIHLSCLKSVIVFICLISIRWSHCTWFRGKRGFSFCVYFWYYKETQIILLIQSASWFAKYLKWSKNGQFMWISIIFFFSALFRHWFWKKYSFSILKNAHLSEYLNIFWTKLWKNHETGIVSFLLK